MTISIINNVTDLRRQMSTSCCFEEPFTENERFTSPRTTINSPDSIRTIDEVKLIFSNLSEQQFTENGKQRAFANIINSLTAPQNWSCFINSVLSSLNKDSEIVKQSYIHGNGFHKLCLVNEFGFKLRLHYYHQDNEFQENIHNHRWDFCSKVILGSFQQDFYKEEDSAHDSSSTLKVWKYDYSSSDESYSLTLLGRASLKRTGEWVNSGKTNCYYLDSNILHRVVQGSSRKPVATIIITDQPFKDTCSLYPTKEINSDLKKTSTHEKSTLNPNDIKRILNYVLQTHLSKLSKFLQRHVSFYLTDIMLKYKSVNSSSDNLNIVMGNESADIDSVSGSITRSVQLSIENPGKTFYPLININRSELYLRRDVVELLDILNISPDLLLFRDEILFSSNHRLHLVDQNVLPVGSLFNDDNVDTIVDHHADEGVHYKCCTEKTIETVGSATTLIAQNLVYSGQKMHHSWATLLAAPILLDTGNLQDPNKTTPIDKNAYSKLEPFLHESFDAGEFFKRLNSQRLNIKGFSTRELLIKDLKNYKAKEGFHYSISSLPNDIGYQWKKDNSLINDFHKIRTDSGKYIAMILELNKGVLRLHVCSEGVIFDQLVRFLSDHKSTLHKPPESKDEEKKIATWVIPNDFTRKKLQPTLFEKGFLTNDTLPS